VVRAWTRSCARIVGPAAALSRVFVPRQLRLPCAVCRCAVSVSVPHQLVLLCAPAHLAPQPSALPAAGVAVPSQPATLAAPSRCVPSLIPAAAARRVWVHSPPSTAVSSLSLSFSTFLPLRSRNAPQLLLSAVRCSGFVADPRLRFARGAGRVALRALSLRYAVASRPCRAVRSLDARSIHAG
jgi:hypothetical protein